MTFTREETLEAEVDRLKKQVRTLNKRNAKQAHIMRQQRSLIDKLRRENRTEAPVYINVQKGRASNRRKGRGN